MNQQVAKKQTRYLPEKIAADDTIGGKLPPQAPELEESVLGTILTSKDAINSIIQFLRPDHFYRDQNASIYEAMIDLFASSEPIDSIMIVAKLRKKGKLEFAGGAMYIAELSSKASSAAQVEYHARVIVEMFIKRKLIQMASQWHHDAYDDTQDSISLLDNAERSVFSITSMNVKQDFRIMPSVMNQALSELRQRIGLPEGIMGVPSGLIDLDRMTSGWQKSDLIIVAARPGMGKTAFVISAGRNAAVDFSKPVAVFSLEMASIQLTNRMIASEAEIHNEQLRKGNLSDEEWDRIITKTGKLSAAPIFIDDTPAISIVELRSKARRLKAEQSIELLIVDYLQLMRGDTSGNREQEIASISRELKNIAKELEIPVIALSQLSRGVETRGGDKRPQLSDLRESGSIEQDADVVMFLYRPEYYNIPIDEDGMPTKGMGEVIIAKHRNGDVGTVKLKFIGQYTKFDNIN